jgi:hypothetical protein
MIVLWKKNYNHCGSGVEWVSFRVTGTRSCSNKHPHTLVLSYCLGIGKDLKLVSRNTRNNFYDTLRIFSRHWKKTRNKFYKKKVFTE